MRQVHFWDPLKQLWNPLRNWGTLGSPNMRSHPLRQAQGTSLKSNINYRIINEGYNSTVLSKKKSCKKVNVFIFIWKENLSNIFQVETHLAYIKMDFTSYHLLIYFLKKLWIKKMYTYIACLPRSIINWLLKNSKKCIKTSPIKSNNKKNKEWKIC